MDRRERECSSQRRARKRQELFGGSRRSCVLLGDVNLAFAGMIGELDFQIDATAHQMMIVRKK